MYIYIWYGKHCHGELVPAQLDVSFIGYELLKVGPIADTRGVVTPITTGTIEVTHLFLTIYIVVVGWAPSYLILLYNPIFLSWWLISVRRPKKRFLSHLLRHDWRILDVLELISTSFFQWTWDLITQSNGGRSQNFTPEVRSRSNRMNH